MGTSRPEIEVVREQQTQQIVVSSESQATAGVIREANERSEESKSLNVNHVSAALTDQNKQNFQSDSTTAVPQRHPTTHNREQTSTQNSAVAAGNPFSDGQKDDSNMEQLQMVMTLTQVSIQQSVKIDLVIIPDQIITIYNLLVAFDISS